MTAHGEVTAFWRDAGAAKWFVRDDEFDTEFRRRFEHAHHAAARGEYEAWMETGDGALALILLLDQFPRNCFRGSAHSYATDGLARRYAERAIAAGLDTQGDAQLRVFFYLPYEHSETREDQDRCVELVAGLDSAEYTRYAELHREIVVRFGRFPHRNAALGRESTREELDFLAEGGFSG